LGDFCLVLVGPELDIALEVRQMLASGGAGFCEERERVVHARDLGGLVNLPLIGFLGSVYFCLPYVAGKRLVGIGRSCQFAAYPISGDFFVSADSVIYVPSSVCQCLV